MKLGLKLTLLSTISVACILLMTTLVIYFVSSGFRKDDYFFRLQTRAEVLAKEINANGGLRKVKPSPSSSSALILEQLVIYDQKGDAVYNSAPELDRQYPESFLEMARLDGSAIYHEHDFEAAAVNYLSPEGHFVIVASAYDQFGFAKLYNLRVTLIFVSIVMLCFSLAAGFLIAGQALAPLTRLVREIEEITVNNLNSRLPVSETGDEVNQLSNSFNQMMERLESSFTMQRNFLANASHELRTPLTAITGQVEVALIKSREKEEYREVLGSVLEETKALTKLTNDLLDLAQTSVNAFGAVANRVRIDELIWQARSDLTRVHSDYSVIVDFDSLPEDESAWEVLGNEQLLKTAFLNIISNACKFSPDHTVEVNLQSEDSKIRIDFKDNGMGISADEINFITEPFYRASNTRQVKGHGLGLALTDKIIKMHRGIMEIASKPNVGTTIRITVPTVH